MERVFYGDKLDHEESVDNFLFTLAEDIFMTFKEGSEYRVDLELEQIFYNYFYNLLSRLRVRQMKTRPEYGTDIRYGTPFGDIDIKLKKEK